ncbi:MAG: formyltransferase family protein [Steroidobacteraceae bacterium]
MTGPRTVLICHSDDPLNCDGIARWLGATTDLVGIIELTETRNRKSKRIKREIKRVGALRFLDVLAFRLYYRLFIARRDADWERRTLVELRQRFDDSHMSARKLAATSPNLAEVEAFLQKLSPDIVIARCKTLLNARIFRIPRRGTFVMHPGVCPEYRNAHGCFWALAQGDRKNVGMTLLKIDEGVDTGPIFGIYSYDFDELIESHYVIQHNVVLCNLERIQARLGEIHAGTAIPIDRSSAPSGTWGQPWLSAYLRYRRAAQQKRARS